MSEYVDNGECDKCEAQDMPLYTRHDGRPEDGTRLLRVCRTCFATLHGRQPITSLSQLTAPPAGKWERGILDWRGCKLHAHGLRLEHVKNNVEGLGTVGDVGGDWTEGAWLDFLMKLAGWANQPALERESALNELRRFWRGPTPSSAEQVEE